MDEMWPPTSRSFRAGGAGRSPAAQHARGSTRGSWVQRSEVIFLHMLWEEGDSEDLSSVIV